MNQDANVERLLSINLSDPLQELAARLVEEDDALLDDLVTIRKWRGLTQEDVSRRMGISQGAVARIESGERNPHLSTLRRYAHAVRAEVSHHAMPFTGPIAKVDPWPESRDWTSAQSRLLAVARRGR